MLASSIYAGIKGETISETNTLVVQRQQLCSTVLAIEPDNSEAQSCLEAARRAGIALTPTPVPVSTNPCDTKGCLRFRVLNYNDDSSCISVRITGVDTSGWTLTIDGLRLGASFGGGDARVCGLGSGQQVTITVRDAGGGPVRGGAGIPSKGSAIMQAAWR
jgi:hypothetical protein